METKHENRISQGNDGILSNQALRANKVNSCGDNSTKRVRTNCNKIKSGYNGATKVDSDSHHQHGDVTMNNNTDTKLEMMHVKVDSSEKVISAGLAGHKAVLEGYKSHVDGKFEASIAQMDADRRVAEANNKAVLERMDADRKAVDARMDADRKAVDARMDADRKAVDARMDADRRVADARHEAMLERIDAKHETVLERIDGNRRANDAEFKAVRAEMKKSFSNLKVWLIITAIGIVSAGLAAWRFFWGS